VLVLGGVVAGALAGACISLVKIMADPYDQLPAITFWLLGSLAGVKMSDLAVAAPLVAVGLVPLVLYRWRIGVLSLGDDEARSLGVDVGRLRGLVRPPARPRPAATLMTASVVAVAGVVGWIGLMMPHIARMLIGPSFSRLLPASMLPRASISATRPWCSPAFARSPAGASASCCRPTTRSRPDGRDPRRRDRGRRPARDRAARRGRHARDAVGDLSDPGAGRRDPIRTPRLRSGLGGGDQSRCAMIATLCLANFDQSAKFDFGEWRADAE
jgi:hypothetical protein